MTQKVTTRQCALAALLIAPDRELAEQFTTACRNSNAFEILSDLKTYPSEHTLEIRLRQLDPDVVLLDASSNVDRALALISHLTRVSFGLSVVALNRAGDPDVVVSILRAGAGEYLEAPFDSATMREAVARLVRLRRPDPDSSDEIGTVVAFSSVKPGSGSSTLAVQTSFALSRTTGARVLLMDLDLTGGTVGFCLKLDLVTSMADAVGQSDRLCPSVWTSLVSSCSGIDVLPAPAIPADEAVDPARLQSVLDHARTLYDWVVVDLRAALDRTSLLTMTQADRVFLISTAELPSLHLARRAALTLEQLGFPKERCEVVMNRVEDGSKLKISEIAKLLRSTVQRTVPNDYFALHRVVATGGPLPQRGALGRAVEQLAAHVVNSAVGSRRVPEAALDSATAFSLS